MVARSRARTKKRTRSAVVAHSSATPAVPVRAVSSACARCACYRPKDSTKLQLLEARGHLLKDELGLDHFAGHSWPGFHHHAALTFLAYGFLALERARGTPTTLSESGPEAAAPFRSRRRRRAPTAPPG